MREIAFCVHAEKRSAGMIFLTEDIGYIITSYYHDDSFLYRTEDAGAHWHEFALADKNVDVSEEVIPNKGGDPYKNLLETFTEVGGSNAVKTEKCTRMYIITVLKLVSLI